jgi:hypothetical protein
MNAIPAEIWVALRSGLVFFGAYLFGSNFQPHEITQLADLIIAFAGAAVALGTVAWTWYVRWGTRAVPTRTAERKDVPTVSAATGQVEPTTSKGSED